MRQKKLMLLGGIRYLLPVIEAAHKQGYYVITADYLPDNYAHKYSDEYVNVNIIDRQEVLKIAEERRIDGIMSFGVDPGVISASYVQNQMGLPSFGPFESIEILQNKDLFRSFLAKNGFNVPRAKGFKSIKEALANLAWFDFPVIVKPTDSAGSKGVSRVDRAEQIIPALENAFDHSISKRIIIEEFIEMTGCPSDTDSMSIDGKLAFVNFNAQRFDGNAANPFTPAAYTWPSTFSQTHKSYLTKEIQRLISLLGLRTSVYNIETRVSKSGTPYIMEFTPRGGGNRLCEMIRFATGVDMITAITRAMVGDPFEFLQTKKINGYWSEIILHSNKTGIFQELIISDCFKGEIIETDLWVKPGEQVHSFLGANNTIGTLVLKFDDQQTMENAISNQKQWLSIIVN